MAYLTFAEYASYGFSTIADDSAFDPIEANAESQFDAVTQSYYVKNSIADDTDTDRVAIFKKSLALQCDFVAKTGITSPTDLVDKDVKSISIGRTSITRSQDYTAVVDSNSGICYSALNLLGQTGLLFRGVGAIWHP
ncbi:MAG: hypothetical protein ABF624_00345 [Liquorilactobacillus ghanensis]|uniref:hypothetical protein n=1 Tax=Liquorilactobacillus ghanensis TaxID=399370 RepID=UPI0039ED5727